MQAEHETRLPALDGVRGLAIVAVLLFHAGVAWMPGGFLGVDTFFVLSGYLITGGLLAEHDASGRLDLVAFWVRRARRLLPALLLVVAATLVATAVLDGGDGARSLRGEVLAALGFVGNWHTLAEGHDYFADMGEPSPLLHLWSLAVEEQLYLVWPLVVVLALRVTRHRHGVLLAAGAVAAASAAWLPVAAATFGADRAYYGTDTRAFALALGAAVAAATARLPDHPALGRVGLACLRAAVVAALVTTAVLWWRLRGQDVLTYRGGLQSAAVATAVVLVALRLLPGGLLARAIGIRPLAGLGRISYGVYLWHWPVQLVLTSARVGLSGWPLLGLRAGLTVGIAAVSYALVERPTIRHVRPRASGGLGIAAVTLGCAAGLLLAVGPPIAADPTPLATAAADVPFAPPEVTSTSTSAPPATATAAPPASPAPRPTAPPTTRRPPPPTPAITATVLGDSVAQSVGRGLAPHGPAHGVRVRDGAILGCGVGPSGTYRLSGTTHELATDCERWAELWTERLSHDRPDVAVVQIGRHEVLDRQLDGAWTQIGAPAYDAYLDRQLEQAVSVVAAAEARLVFLTAPYFSPREAPDGRRYPENDPRRVEALNAMVRAVAARHPGLVTVVDLGARVAPDGRYTATVDGVRVRSDGVHYSAAGCAWFAPWLLPQVYAFGRA